MPKRATGRYERTTVGGEEIAAFIPHALPPKDPPIAVDGPLTERLRAAEHALVRLELAGEMVPSLDWFIYAFVRKEAVLSSQIEGTQATLVDLLAFEAQGSGEQQSAPPNADIEEVCNYPISIGCGWAPNSDSVGRLAISPPAANPATSVRDVTVSCVWWQLPPAGGEDKASRCWSA